jgi:hypothetical protein
VCNTVHQVLAAVWRSVQWWARVLEQQHLPADLADALEAKGLVLGQV